MIEYRFCPQCAGELSTRKLEGSLRLACDSEVCGFVHWNSPVPVVAALVKVADRFLLARNQAWPEGMFSMITGFLDQQESPEAGIRRELEEELSLQAGDVRFIGHYPLGKRNQLIIGYLVEAFGEPRLNEELLEYCWLTRDQLQQYDFGPLRLTAEMVRDALARI